MENVIFLLKMSSKTFTAHGAQNVLGVLKTAFPLVLFACLIRGSWLPSKDSSPRINVLHPPASLPARPFPLALVGGPFGARGEGQKLKGLPHSTLTPAPPSHCQPSPLLPCFIFPSPPCPRKGPE